MTDNWPDEEGFISEGEIVSLFKATAAVTKGTYVQLTGDLEVQPAVADSDSIGVALKDASRGEKAPICVLKWSRAHSRCHTVIGSVNRSTSNATNTQSLDSSDSGTHQTAMTTNYGV